MPSARSVVDITAAACAVSWRRFRRGPGRPSWSWSFEVLVDGMRRTSRRLGALPPVEQRSAWERSAVSTPFVRERIRREPITLGGVPGETFTPVACEPGLTVLYFHGGAYVFGSTTTLGELISRFAIAAKARVIGPNYRLAPEHTLPAALDDCLAAWRGLRASGVPASEIVLAGDSAGTALSIAVMVALREAGEELPRGAVLIGPWMDLSAADGTIVTHAHVDWGDAPGLAECGRLYLGGADPKDPRASPTYADLHGLPPLFVQVGGAEMMLDTALEFVRRAKAAGTPVDLRVWPDMVHEWHALAPFVAVGRDAIIEAGEAARRLVAEPDANTPPAARAAS
jgi:acetyl esterase/lipase